MATELVGGQALVEGVMMRRGETWSAAARCPDGTIVTTRRHIAPTMPTLASVPLLRGINALVDSVRVGLVAMAWSREQERSEVTASRRSELVVVIAVVAAVLVAFLWVPIAVAAPVMDHLGPLVGALVEGLARLAMFVGYLAVISRLPGIRRTLEYHGAEHMVVAAHEHGAPMRLAVVRGFSPRHPRCGTDFFFLIFALSIVVFAVAGDLPTPMLIVSRLLLGPLVVGISYEVLRFAGTRDDTLFGRVMAAPGLALQRFTTREPDEDQIEIAMVALAALDPTPHAHSH